MLFDEYLCGIASVYGGPARVVNTQENSVISGNGSRTDFTIASLFAKNVLNEVDSFNIRDVSVNGMRCVPVKQGICQVPMCNSSSKLPQALLGHVSNRMPSCMSIFCCGDELIMENNFRTEQQCFSELPTAIGNTAESGVPDPEEQEASNSNGRLLSDDLVLGNEHVVA